MTETHRLTWSERRLAEEKAERRLQQQEAVTRKRRPLEEAQAANRRLMLLLGAALAKLPGVPSVTIQQLADEHGLALNRPALKDEHERYCRTAESAADFLNAWDRYRVYLYGPRRRRRRAVTSEPPQ